MGGMRVCDRQDISHTGVNAVTELTMSDTCSRTSEKGFRVLIIGSGISGMTAAISLAERGIASVLLSPFVSERSQSVMAAGGINAALDNKGERDSVGKHIEDTLRGGCYIAGADAALDLCSHAPGIIKWLEKLGTVFTLNERGEIDQRAFGGQSHRRTCYCGASTGKQIVSALVMECRRYEAMGLIERRLWSDFHSGLIHDGRCCGALIFNEATASLEPVYADAVIMATGGQNALFGKTTGSTQCDGYAAGRLFMQGALLKNLEFIQYHPTTMETAQKKMLISEAARGEGGRLYYNESGRRVYFMEDRFGPSGNLMPRDVVSRCMYETGRDIYLDVSHLGSDVIDNKIPEVRDLCLKYGGLDIKNESIPVVPSVHYFMGGFAADENHETNIRNLYAVGECASRYHGANRLGGNSLLSAIYSGMTAAESIADRKNCGSCDEISDAWFDTYIREERAKIVRDFSSGSKFPVMYIRDMAAEVLNDKLGIVRDDESLQAGIDDIDFYIRISSQIRYDSSVLEYFNYSLPAILTLAKAVLISAKERKESRGAHIRSDYPETSDEYKAASLISYADGEFSISYDTEGRYEH